MKKILLIIAFLPLLLCAEETRPNLLKDMAERVTVVQDSAITRLLIGEEGEMVEIKGYRVQVFSSNDQQSSKNNALEMEKKMNEAELGVQVYLQYNPPFWKVRIGDFRTDDEAKLMKEEVVRRFPELKGDTYVVRDQITVRK